MKGFASAAAVAVAMIIITIVLLDCNRKATPDPILVDTRDLKLALQECLLGLQQAASSALEKNAGYLPSKIETLYDMKRMSSLHVDATYNTSIAGKSSANEPAGSAAGLGCTADSRPDRKLVHADFPAATFTNEPLEPVRIGIDGYIAYASMPTRLSDNITGILGMPDGNASSINDSSIITAGDSKRAAKCNVKPVPIRHSGQLPIVIGNRHSTTDAVLHVDDAQYVVNGLLLDSEIIELGSVSWQNSTHAYRVEFSKCLPVCVKPIRILDCMVDLHHSDCGLIGKPTPCAPMDACMAICEALGLWKREAYSATFLYWHTRKSILGRDPHELTVVDIPKSLEALRQFGTCAEPLWPNANSRIVPMPDDTATDKAFVDARWEMLSTAGDVDRALSMKRPVAVDLAGYKAAVIVRKCDGDYVCAGGDVIPWDTEFINAVAFI